MPVIYDAQERFLDAINKGFLSVDPLDGNYAGLYMYMFSDDDVDYFKNIITRKYLINHAAHERERK